MKNFFIIFISIILFVCVCVGVCNCLNETRDVKYFGARVTGNKFLAAQHGGRE